MTHLIDRARDWIAGDPDEETRAQLQEIVDSGDRKALEDAMGATLQFGTAGIRGEVGPGSNRMNRATVIRTTAGLVSYLDSFARNMGPVVIGYDARPSSRAFAEDAAGVIGASGRLVRYFPDVAPTPLVAFAAKHLGAVAAIVVTASHNPPQDNGYKVYATNGAQIIPPWDVAIADAVEQVGAAKEVPRLEGVFAERHELVVPIDPSIVDDYWEEVDEARPAPHPSDMTIVYTPIHGVGGTVLTEMFNRGGHRGLVPVPTQMDPNGRFPTVSFPNPEEEGALDLALALASDRRADVVIANDPDADRFAAAVPLDGEWRLLSGNELGTLLGDHVLRHWDKSEKAIVVNSIVSSPILGRLADVYGAHYEATLTGFKWIVNAALALENRGEGVFAFGFEEALGYTVGRTVRDKDGISAALVFCDLVADLRDAGSSVLDRLYEIWNQVGMWVSAQQSIVRTGQKGQELIVAAVDRLGTGPPTGIGGLAVTSHTDYRTGAENRPFWLGSQNLIELTLGDKGRLLVRPSGTEPKLKIYVDLTESPGRDVAASQREALAKAQGVAGAMADWLDI